MGLQTINGQLGYVAEFEVLPELPFTTENEIEMPYAEALTHAIETGWIAKPGKYFIYFMALHGQYAKYNVLQATE